MLARCGLAGRWCSGRLAAALIITGTLGAGPVAAQDVAAAAAGGFGSYADPDWGRQGEFICRRWCLEDRTPCDPVSFKAADGRCFGTVRTFFGELKCRIRGETNPACPTAH